MSSGDAVERVASPSFTVRCVPVVASSAANPASGLSVWTPGVLSTSESVVLAPSVSKDLPASTPPAPLRVSLALAGAK
jgi:hypothetical protein